MAQARKGMRPGARTRPGHLEPGWPRLKLSMILLWILWEKPSTS